MSTPFSPYAPPASDDRTKMPGSPGARELPPASALVAALLSLLVPGLGHVYAAHYRRALAWVSLHAVLFVVLALATRFGGSAFIGLVLGDLVLEVGVIRVGATIDVVRVVGRRPGPRAPVLPVIAAGLLFYMFTVAVAFAQRRFVVEAFKVPAGSMIPTIFVGDHLFVDKQRAVHRGDVVVFPFPEHPEQDFVKRIVGMPGDRILFRDGHPFINDVEVPHCVVGPYSYAETDDPIQQHSGTLEIERLDGRPHFAFYDAATVGLAEVQGPWIVKNGEAFVLGDNRNNSHDSRMWFAGQGGGMPLDTVVGVAYVVWLSVSDGVVDWSRTGHVIEELRLPASMSAFEPALQRCLGESAGR